MRLIDADEFLKRYKEANDIASVNPMLQVKADGIIEDTPTVDAVPVVRCKDCIYFQQEQVKTSEGIYRNKFPNEGMVSVDVGINIGSHCKRVVDVREEGFRDGEPTIERTYLWRNEDDFCSRGKRKTDDT